MAVTQLDKGNSFRALHQGTRAFVIANAWDAGSARVLAGLGFAAIATSSYATAGAYGTRDGRITCDQALAHARAIVDATDLPVSVDLESGFGATANDVAETYRHAAAVGLVGATIEDATPTSRKDKPLFDIGEATERVAAAVAATRKLGFPFMLTARAEGFRRGNTDLDDTIKRLQAYEKAGADVLMASGFGVGEGGVRRDREAVQFHGRHSGQVVHRCRAGSGWRASHQPRRLALSRHDGRTRRRRARVERQGNLRLRGHGTAVGGARRIHAGVSTLVSVMSAGGRLGCTIAMR